MAKKIVEYKLHGGQVPYFIEDGGHWLIGGKMVGITKDDSECHIPAAVADGGELVVLSNSDLVSRIEGLTLLDEEGKEMATAAKTTLANNWLKDKGMDA